MIRTRIVLAIDEIIIPPEHLKPVRILYERGFALKSLEKDWYLLHLTGGNLVKIQDPTLPSSRYGARPLLLTDKGPDGRERDWLRCNNQDFTWHRSAFFAHRVFELDQLILRKLIDVQRPASRPDQLLYNTQNIIYSIRSVDYHCLQLGNHYASICERFSRYAVTLGDSKTCRFAHQSEVYFEFDALVTAVRRAYDSCRYLMWQCFGPGKSNTPNAFSKTLRQCKLLPGPVAQRLTKSWSNFGEPLKELRDWILHYYTIDQGHTAVHMEKLDLGAWVTSAFIPDNPSARGRTKFTYDQRRDALTYGWEAASEILDVVSTLLEAVIAKQDRRGEGGHLIEPCRET